MDSFPFCPFAGKRSSIFQQPFQWCLRHFSFSLPRLWSISTWFQPLPLIVAMRYIFRNSFCQVASILFSVDRMLHVFDQHFALRTTQGFSFFFATVEVSLHGAFGLFFSLLWLFVPIVCLI